MCLNVSMTKKNLPYRQIFFCHVRFSSYFCTAFRWRMAVVAVLPSERREVNGTTESEVARVCGLAYLLTPMF